MGRRDPQGTGVENGGRSRLFLAFACVYFFWGTTYLGIRYALETFPPFLMGFLRFSAAALCYYLFLKVTGR